MNREHAKQGTRSRVRSSMLRTLIDRLRGHVGGSARQGHVGPATPLDAPNPTREARERWAEITRGLHDPDEPLVLDEEGSREVIDEIINGSPRTPERAATFERVRFMAEVHRHSEALEHTVTGD